LVLFTVARASGLLGPPKYAYVSVGLLTVALVLIAWSAGGTRADLGLGRTDVRAGVRYGAGAFGVVLLVLIVAAVIPATNGFLHDSRAKIDGSRLLLRASGVDRAANGDPGGVRLSRRSAGVGAEAMGAMAREPDHLGAVRPLAHRTDLAHDVGHRLVAGASTSVGGQVLVVFGSVAVTFIAGLVFCWLRLRSRSLIAPVMAHVATNGVALAVCVVYRPLGPSQVITTGGVCPVGLV